MSLKKILIAIAVFFSGNQAVAASTATAMTFGMLAWGAGVDPWPWILGGMGCTVVYAYKPPDTRAKALAHAMISLFLGGMGAAYIAGLLKAYGAGDWANTYVLSFALSASWPWLAPVVFDKFRSVIGALSFTKGGKNE